MADRYLLESGAPDGYQLEDGSGVLLLETQFLDFYVEPQQPLVRRRVLAAALVASIGLIAPTFVPDASAAVLSSDGPAFTRTIQYQSTAFVAVVAPAEPETVTLDKWYQPWPDPVRRAPRRSASELAAPVFVPAAAAEEITLDKWLSESSQPLRRGRRPASEFAAPVREPAFAAEEVTLDKWYQPWFDPQRVKARQQPELAAPVFTPAAAGDVLVAELFVDPDTFYAHCLTAERPLVPVPAPSTATLNDVTAPTPATLSPESAPLAATLTDCDCGV